MAVDVTPSAKRILEFFLSVPLKEMCGGLSENTPQEFLSWMPPRSQTIKCPAVAERAQESSRTAEGTR